MIHAPTYIIGDDHRSLELEEMLCVPFRNLVDEAATAGWSNEEVLDALEQLVLNNCPAFSNDPHLAEDPDPEIRKTLRTGLSMHSLAGVSLRQGKVFGFMSHRIVRMSGECE